VALIADRDCNHHVINVYSALRHMPPTMWSLIIRDVSGVGRRNYAVGETYVVYGVGRKMVA
jgi:hypothetical protein